MSLTNTILKLVEEIKEFDFTNLDEGYSEQTFKVDGYELVVEVKTGKEVTPTLVGDRFQPNEYDVEVDNDFEIQALWNSEDEEVEMSEYHYKLLNKALSKNEKQAYSY